MDVWTRLGIMRISDDALAEIDSNGFTVVEGLLDGEEVAAAREGIWHHHPRPEDYFADPERYSNLHESGFAGIDRGFPFATWDLNRVCFHPDLVDAAKRYLGSEDLSLYKVELWAKYSGAADYEQAHHRDYANHTLVVPRADGVGRQLTTFTLLTDVTEADAPTRIVRLQDSAHLPLVLDESVGTRPTVLPMGELTDVEIPVVGPAGSVLLYRTDVFHRATDFAEPGRSRFTMLADFEVSGPTWTGKVAWPNHANSAEWRAFLPRLSVDERSLFGFPKPGDPYWNEQTVVDVGARYPDMDMTPYRPV